MRIAAPFALAGSILVLGFAATGVAWPQAQSAAATANCDTTEADLDAAELDMLRGINAERAKVGAGALVASPALNRAAAWKSADSSATFGPGFSHTDSRGRSASARAADCGYPHGAGENIAYGLTAPADTIQAWMGSPGHRANILNPAYRVIGIGRHGSAWTTDFGFVDDSTSGPPTATKTPTATPTPEPAYPAAGIRMDLGAGINLVTYAGTERPAAIALASLTGRVRAVYEWNATSGRWEKYIPTGPAYVSTFTTLKQGRVYSIELATPGTWVY